MIKVENYSGRIVKEEIECLNNGEEFSALYLAREIVLERGYDYGSTSVRGPIPISTRPYSIPQKWHNLDQEDIDKLIGVIGEGDARNGSVIIFFF